MKLYLLSQIVNCGYDTYSNCVVCANDHDDAAMITPNPDGKWGNGWAHRPEEIIVEYLGEARDGLERGVICASYHAG